MRIHGGDARPSRAEWQFIAADARAKLKTLYPIIEMQ
jgi:hypothetical protein